MNKQGNPLELFLSNSNKRLLSKIYQLLLVEN